MEEIEDQCSNRYIIKYGKYEAYFYDTVEKKDIMLKEVRDFLNKLDVLNSKIIRLIKKGVIK